MAAQFQEAYDEPHVRYLLESGEFPMLQRFAGAGEPRDHPDRSRSGCTGCWTASRHRCADNLLGDGHRVRREGPPHPRLSGRRRLCLGGADRQARLQRVALPADPGRDRGGHQGPDRAQPLPGPDERRAAPRLERAHGRAGAADRGRQRLLRHPARGGRRAARAGRRARVRVALLQRLPAPVGGLRRPRDRGAAGRRAPPPARQDGRGDHRRHAPGDRLQPEQSDLDRAAAGRDRRSSSSASRATWR